MQTVDLLPTVLVGTWSAAAVRTSTGTTCYRLIRGEQTKFRDYACLGMDAEEFAIRTHLWHLTLPVEPDPDDPPRGPELYRKPEDRWDRTTWRDCTRKSPTIWS